MYAPLDVGLLHASIPTYRLLGLIAVLSRRRTALESPVCQRASKLHMGCRQGQVRSCQKISQHVQYLLSAHPKRLLLWADLVFDYDSLEDHRRENDFALPVGDEGEHTYTMSSLSCS